MISPISPEVYNSPAFGYVHTLHGGEAYHTEAAHVQENPG
jgi:hypothetical protein